MKRNTKVQILQLLLATVGMIQLLESAFFMALLSIIAIYPIGALENGE